jgi:hypothetical protein
MSKREHFGEWHPVTAELFLDDDCPGELDITVEHLPSCPQRDDVDSDDCDMAWSLRERGFDSEGWEQITTPGRYEARYWVEEIYLAPHIAMGPEYSDGVEVREVSNV